MTRKALVSAALAILLALPAAAARAAPLATDLVDLNGAKVSLEPARNRVLLVFWATWCPSCREKFRNELAELAKDPGLDVIAINTETDAGRVRSFVEREKIGIPVYRDPAEILTGRLQVRAVPHWAVYERANAGADWRLRDSAPAFDLERIRKSLN